MCRKTVAVGCHFPCIAASAAASYPPPGRGLGLTKGGSPYLMPRLFAQRRAARPLPLRNGWMRTHSECAHAHTSITAASWSTSSAVPARIKASSRETAFCSTCSKATSAGTTSRDAIPRREPISTSTFSSPGSPRNFPTAPILGTVKPVRNSRCQLRAAARLGLTRRRASSRIRWSNPCRLCLNFGLSSSQSGMEQAANFRLHSAGRPAL